jgi:hypothetical protein
VCSFNRFVLFISYAAVVCGLERGELVFCTIAEKVDQKNYSLFHSRERFLLIARCQMKNAGSNETRGIQALLEIKLDLVIVTLRVF